MSIVEDNAAVFHLKEAEADLEEEMRLIQGDINQLRAEATRQEEALGVVVKDLKEVRQAITLMVGTGNKLGKVGL